MHGFFSEFEFYYEHTARISFNTIIAAVLNIILNYVFIDIFGYYAAGYTTLLCYVICTVMHYYGMRKACSSSATEAYAPKILITLSAAFLAVTILLLLLYRSFVIRYAIILLILMLAYAIATI